MKAGGLAAGQLGFGAMRLTGPGIWGDPPSRAAAIAVLRRAVDLGVSFVDTADSYGPFVSEELIAAALFPYAGVTVATKGGLVRTGPGEWHAVGRPEYLRQCVELSLRRLRVERIELYQLHRMDPQVPLADQLGALDDLRQQGKIARIGLSEVTVPQIAEARMLAPVASVQNRYSVTDRRAQGVLDYCAREDLAFIAWAPMASGRLAGSGGPLGEMAAQAGATPGQVALAWLLGASPVVLPIPGTASVAHLEENLAAARLTLTPAQRAELTALTAAGAA
jgi:pyridoxine 4-dehydrogenase